MTLTPEQQAMLDRLREWCASPVSVIILQLDDKPAATALLAQLESATAPSVPAQTVMQFLDKYEAAVDQAMQGQVDSVGQIATLHADLQTVGRMRASCGSMIDEAHPVDRKPEVRERQAHLKGPG